MCRPTIVTFFSVGGRAAKVWPADLKLSWCHVDLAVLAQGELSLAEPWPAAHVVRWSMDIEGVTTGVRPTLFRKASHGCLSA